MFRIGNIMKVLHLRDLEVRQFLGKMLKDQDEVDSRKSKDIFRDKADLDQNNNIDE